MSSLENICEKFALLNAWKYDEAETGSVMGMIMTVHPELRQKAKDVKKVVAAKVLEVNNLTKEDVVAKLKAKYPDKLAEEQQKEEAEIEEEGSDFIRKIIDKDLEEGRYDRVHTRFPPEPNGYLHLGHATSIIMNYLIAKDYNGKFNFRFDDTNPITEEERYVKAMIEDIKWLGVYEKRDDGDNVLFASDYFEQFYEYALQMVKKGKAYVDDLSAEEISEYRGTLTEPGKESPYRDRSIEENLDLFKRMKAGEFPDGARVLRAKIDMQSPNLNLRDPVMYRILHEEHPHRGGDWCIYPMYDWAHGLEDSIESITHSICTLEFENHRPLYNWYLEQLEDEEGNPIHHPRQIEFARVNLSHTITSKTKLLRLVNEGHVIGWDDPRMPTLAGLRRRGVTPEAIFKFTRDIGVSKRDKVIDRSIFEACIRDDLNKRCPRVMAVIHPLKVIIENYPENQVERFEAPNHPTREDMGSRKVPFSNVIYIERDDFREHPPEGYYRLALGKEVRLKYAYYITCTDVIKDKNGKITELRCSYDPKSKGGSTPDGRDVQGTIHWVSKAHSIPFETRLIERLSHKANPLIVEEGQDFTDNLNPHSLEVETAYGEPSLTDAKPRDRFQFERLGYFYVDPKLSNDEKLVFNRTITLKDTWSKKQK